MESPRIHTQKLEAHGIQKEFNTKYDKLTPNAQIVLREASVYRVVVPFDYWIDHLNDWDIELGGGIEALYQELLSCGIIEINPDDAGGMFIKPMQLQSQYKPFLDVIYRDCSDVSE